ncbi:hypothetical protein FOZ63_011025 [Perkinsus olseni]|uniref:Uncharacterized protein n=1 Tax=Perkinsus olseni TaxID=32597 RepID=A0A7J6RVS8_PEROL|nr:hypothetical protein FOZ63_011025 [Perkinsus olseni]
MIIFITQNCGVLPEVTDDRVSDAGGVHEVPWYKKCSVLKLPEDITIDELHDVPVTEIRRKWESEKMDNKREKLPSSSRGGPTRKREQPLREELRSGQQSAVSAVADPQMTN